MDTESSQKDEDTAQQEKPTMNPLAVTSVLANFLFATAPFTYPFGFVRCGPAVSVPLLCVSCFCSYMTAEFLIEAVASVNYLKTKRRGLHLKEMSQYIESPSKEENTVVLDESGYKEPGCVEVPSLHLFENTGEVKNACDDQVETEETKGQIKEILNDDSTFQVAKKQELSELANELFGSGLQFFVVLVLVPYMYGALLVKHVAGSESLIQSISFNIYKDRMALKKKSSIDPYLIGLFAFSLCTLGFTFGNIENSRLLQVVSSFLRYLVICLFFVGTIYSLVVNGRTSTSYFGSDQIDLQYAQLVFGSSFFTFLCHHSLSGAVAPLEPKQAYRKSFLTAHIIALVTLLA